MSLAEEHGLWAPVVMGGRKDRSEFGKAPRQVRDEIIAGLDNGELTIEAAAERMGELGHPVSRTAMSNAYMKLRRARRSQRNQDSLAELISEFRAQPSDQAFDSLAKLLAAQVAEALLNEEESKGATIKAAARALETMAGLAKVGVARAKIEAERERAGSDPKEPVSLEDVLERVYGIRRK